MLVAALVTLVAPTAWNKIEGGRGHVRHQAMKGFGSEFLDAVQGLPTLKAFGQSTAYGKRLAERARLLSETTMKVLSTSVMTRGITDAGVAIGAAVALGLGVWRVSHGEMSITALLIVLMAGTEVFRPLRDLRSVLHQGMVGQSAAAGITALLESEPLVPPAAANASHRTLAPTIEFDRVCFAYPGGRQPAHDALSFTVAAGEKIGIVGPSGSGKSSSRGCCCASSTRNRVASRSAAGICASSTPRRCGRRSRSSTRTPICSTARSRRICGSAGPTRPSPSSNKPRATPTRMISSWRCRRATRRCSASAASTCRAGSASAWRSPARCCAIRRS
jgi:hypothetical protein